MKLKLLLQDLTDYPIPEDSQVTGLSLNSKHIQPGELFIALKGTAHDGRVFIPQAITQGARAIVCEAQGLKDFFIGISPKIPVIPIENLDQHLATLTQRYYGEPHHDLQLLGVTGTNGKTTTTYLLAQALTKLGIPCAVLGTTGYGFVNKLSECGLTTPDIISLAKYFSSLKKKGAKAVAMEVSSHGLEQNRVKHVNFCSAIFTNLTQDHLDYHGTMENYGRAKQKLFLFPSLERAILNADAPFSEKILPLIARHVPVALCSLNPSFRIKQSREQTYAIYAKEMNLTPKGITALIQTPWGQGRLNSPLLGEFNLNNLLGVIAELCLREIKLADALEALSQATAPPGRMQRFGGVHAPQVIVDYAHTPDALENVLQAARVHCRRKLWCVFGCGGDRDKDKRAKMGAIAAKYADRIVLTNDNPRHEPPQQIIGEIIQGLAGAAHKVTIEEDRKKAIAYAISQSLPVDTILVAGKGHENYQIVGHTVLPFDDAQVVKTLLNEDNNNEIVNPS